MFQLHNPDTGGNYQQNEMTCHNRKMFIMDTMRVKRSQPGDSRSLEKAHEYYSAGNFVEARNAAQAILSKDSCDTSAKLLLAAIEFGSDNPNRYFLNTHDIRMLNCMLIFN